MTAVYLFFQFGEFSVGGEPQTLMAGPLSYNDALAFTTTYVFKNAGHKEVNVTISDTKFLDRATLTAFDNPGKRYVGVTSNSLPAPTFQLPLFVHEKPSGRASSPSCFP